MSAKDLMDSAYEIAKKEYKDKSFSFNLIYGKISAKFSNLTMGEIYLEFLQDTRFFLLNKNTWKLREYMTKTEIKKKLANLYNLDENLEEGGTISPSMDKKIEIEVNDDENDKDIEE